MSESDRLIAELVNVDKNYGEDRQVLKSCSLSVPKGESVAVVGPSGSGKSTLLNLLAALDTPTEGNVRIDGEDLSEMNESALAALRNRKIGFVFQLHHLLDQCTVGENVLLPSLPAGQSKEAVTRARKLLDRVDLGDRVHDFPGRLSGGQRQRVAVVRALVNKPALLLADEPTGSLDGRTAGEVADLLADLQQEEQVAMVVVTHSEQIAARMSRVLHLVDGQLVEKENGAAS